jgi:hypothetical protein
MFYEIKVVASTVVLCRMFMTRRASTDGLFSNFEHLAQLSGGTSGVFLHTYILITRKSPPFPNKLFLLPLLYSSFLFVRLYVPLSMYFLLYIKDK